MIVIERATEPKDILPPILTPYFEASAQEVTDKVGAGATSIDYETYNTLYKVGQLGVYFIHDADEGLLIGYCLALESRGFITSDIYLSSLCSDSLIDSISSDKNLSSACSDSLIDSISSISVSDL